MQNKEFFWMKHYVIVKKKIKDHEYVVDISIMSKQFFMINNKKQYNRLKFWYKKGNISVKKYEYIHLFEIFMYIIGNKYLIENLLKENDDEFLISVIRYKRNNFYLFYLYNYSYIYTKLLVLFYIGEDKNVFPNFEFEIFKYFYSNVHKYLLDNFVELNKDKRTVITIVRNLVRNYGKDINILNYCSSIINKYNLKNIIPTDLKYVRLQFLHSLKYMEYFSKELHPQNSLYLKCDNQYISTFINKFLTYFWYNII